MIYYSPDRERCENIAIYMLDTCATVRSAAQYFGISKSTVHKDVSQTLKAINYTLYLSVAELLAINKSERHLRGGEATRKKYELKRIKNI